MTRLRVGPVPTDGAHAWIDNTLELLDALERSPLLPFALSDDTVDDMRHHLRGLRSLVDRGAPEIAWECEADGPELRSLLTYWVNIGQLSEETLRAAGVGWASDEGERFHARLLRSVIDGLAPIDAPYAERLERAWHQPALAHRRR
jgi:hypothetical protein